MAVEISIILAIRFWPRALGEGMMREKGRTGEATRAGQGWRKIFARGSLSSPVPQQNANGRIVLCGGTLFRRGEGKRATRALKYRNAVGVLSTAYLGQR